MSVADGLYELRPYFDTSLALNIQGASKTKGAKANIKAADGGNDQKFSVAKSGSYWYLEALHSGMVLSTEKSNAQSGQGVVQWTSANENWCKWTIAETGSTATVEGVSGCAVVTLEPKSGSGLLLDASSAKTSGFAKTRTAESAGPEADYQKWVLFPTYRYWEDGPIPFDGGISTSIGGSVYTKRDVTATPYPTFKIPQSWVLRNKYSWRWTVRDMAPDGRWGAWTDGAGNAGWTNWEEPRVERRGTRVWVKGSKATVPATWPLDAEYEFSECKHRQFRFEVCCQDTYSDGVRVCPTYAFTVDICKRPTFAFSEAVMSPLGLSLEFGTDYELGTNRLKLVKAGPWSGERIIEDLVDGDEILLPIEMVGWLEEDTPVYLEWYVGNDQNPMHGGSRNNLGSEPAVSYTGGSIDISYTEASVDVWGVVTVKVKDANGLRSDARAWVSVDGELTELKGSGGTFTGLVTSTSCKVFAVVGSSSSYGMWGQAYQNLIYSPSHAIYAPDGKMVIIGLREGSPISEEHSLAATYDATALDARGYESVRFAPTRKSTYAIEGALVEGVSTVTLEDIDVLVGEHVRYRTPTGRMLTCAVVGVATSAHSRWSEVSISLVEETV